MVELAEEPNCCSMKSCTAGCRQAAITAAVMATVLPTTGSRVAADIKSRSWGEYERGAFKETVGKEPKGRRSSLVEAIRRSEGVVFSQVFERLLNN